MKLLLIFISSLLIYPSIAFSLSLQDVTIDAILDMGLSNDQVRLLGSGDIVGNGGGKAEADFHYAYRKLNKFIKDCSSTYKCNITSDQKNILKKISTVSLLNKNKIDKLIFLNSNTVPGFFHDENDPEERIAKTGFSLNSPIFINLDLIYNHSNKLIDLPSIVAILIHEIGHQTGIKEHQLLDDLGARVRDFLNQEKLQAKISVNQIILKIFAFNFKNDHAYSELNLSYMQHNIEFGQRIFAKTKCSSEATELVGYKIENIHFHRVIKEGIQAKKRLHIPLEAWMTLNCKNKDGIINTEEKDLSINFVIHRRFLPPGLIHTVEDVVILVQ